MNYEIVRYRPEFKEEILALQTYLWGPDLAVNAEYLKWKYTCNPYVEAREAPQIYVALCGGQAVGMIGSYGAKWQIGNPAKALLWSWYADLVIHPDHRKHGLFAKLFAAGLNDLVANNSCTHVLVMFPCKKVCLGLLKHGWRHIGFLQEAHWVKKLSLIPSAFRRRHDIPATVSIEQAPRPEAMAELVERIGSNGRIRHIKDKEYFTWRFKCPLSQYRFLFWEGSRIEGYLVLQRSIYTNRKLVKIVDWEFTNTQVWADLIHASIQWGNFGGMAICSHTLPEEAKTVLRNSGFNFLEETGNITFDVSRPTILITPVHQKMLETDWVLANCCLLDSANWDLREIYFDHT